MPNELRKGAVTICVVNYKTEELTRLCLRSIRKRTKVPYEVVVVDNDSGDGSLDYLRSLDWINLVERPGEVERGGSWAHGTALDIGLDNCETEFFLALHSATFGRKSGWLEELVSMAGDDAACGGGGKLDLRHPVLDFLKRATDYRMFIKRKIKKDEKTRFYARTICSLYRTEVLRKENLRFAMGVEDGFTCGKKLYYEIVDRGYPVVTGPERTMAGLVYHLAPAAMGLNPEFTVRTRTERKFQKKIKKILASPEVKEVTEDGSLDK
jgi:GT2 family glycosyltransferase